MSCHSATANQVRLVLHTAAFWLMHGVRAAIPQTSPLATAEFATIRERLIKIGARVIECRGAVPQRTAEKADQSQTCCTASSLTPIQTDRSPARDRRPDVQKRLAWCMIRVREGASCLNWKRGARNLIQGKVDFGQPI